jgi:flagellar L-ring protein precursor FlgH
MKPAVLAVACLALAGCAAHDNLITGTPELSPVGEGLPSTHDPLPVSLDRSRHTSFQSLWGDNDRALYDDLKADRVGDVLTVNIQIDDMAQFDNQSDRSRTSGTGIGFGAKLGFGGFGAEAQSGDASGNLSINSSSAYSGEGSIGRSEKLRLSIAAIVVEEMPNGNLIIDGSQEVMVNNEVRVLSIAGIVRQSDISTDNSIEYDKIAEARISYGGRGRVSDVQKPAWGQRLYDAAVPF